MSNPKPRALKLASGKSHKLPAFDPRLAGFCDDTANLVDHLIKEVNDGLYAEYFEKKKDIVFLDIGANIGLVSIYAAPVCKRIVAIEPAPPIFEVLKAMVIGFDNIELVQAALAPVDGDVPFFLNDINSTASSTVNTYGQRMVVRGLKLRDILRIHQLEHVDIAKIDAEGAEGESLTYQELEAAKPVIKSYHIECHNCPKTKWEHKLSRLVEMFCQLGYHKMQIHGMTLRARLP